MRYELTDGSGLLSSPCCRTSRVAFHGLTTAVSSMASSGSCAPERLGVICPRRLVRTPPATTDLFGGGGLVSGAASSTRLPVPIASFRLRILRGIDHRSVVTDDGTGCQAPVQEVSRLTRSPKRFHYVRRCRLLTQSASGQWCIWSRRPSFAEKATAKVAF
jgi:hypothetical protein